MNAIRLEHVTVVAIGVTTEGERQVLSLARQRRCAVSRILVIQLVSLDGVGMLHVVQRRVQFVQPTPETGQLCLPESL